MIFKGSRYSHTEVISPVAADGRAPRVLATREVPPAPGALEHMVFEGDRLDTLAARYYSEPTKYWLILDANPEPLNPFELLVPGTIIRIPRNRIVGP
jgi:nucleoid-associated protein YgaU